MNTYWISLPCDLLSSLASFQCSLLHHLHLSSDLGLSKYVNQHSHLNLSRNVHLPVLYDLDFNSILNHISTASLGGQVPLQVLYGVTPDISMILLYTFYQPAFYATHDQDFPSDSEERAGSWVEFSEHCCDSLTHIVLDAVTIKIINRSALRPRMPKDPNNRLDDAGGEEAHPLMENPLKLQLQCQMGRSLLNQIPLLYI